MNILFLCTGNSCRSQMAEALARHKLSTDHRFFSAGTKTHGMNPRAIQVLEELGLDTSQQRSKTLEEVPENLDLVITVCSDADENCPHMPGVVVHHQAFDDPPRITKDFKDEEEILKVYRRVRDEISSYIDNLPKIIEENF
ncbi:MAG: arsenate reductase ArsC [Bdellovibrionota bacterium]|nr:arsenate reductase ArsC [Bdellovibrionota bacterium]